MSVLTIGSVVREIPVALLPAVDALIALAAKAAELSVATRLETTVHEGLNEVDRLAMQACVTEAAGRAAREGRHRDVRCLHCADTEEGWCEPAGMAPRQIYTRRGRIVVEREVFRCPCCGRRRVPFDEEIGLRGKEHLTPLVRRTATWLGAVVTSYGRAEQTMREMLDLPLSAKEIQRVTEEAGQAAADLRDENVRRLGRPASPEAPIPVDQQHDTLVIQVDGTCVMGRDGEGHEVKCGTVFGLNHRATTGSPGKERPVLIERAYTATSRGVRAFQAMVWAMAVSWGVRRARKIVFMGDGADWIWKMSADRFTFHLADGTELRPIEILDFYHACENIGKACNEIFRNPESEEAKSWSANWRQRLRAGEVDALVNELRRYASEATPANSKHKLQLRADYFNDHRDRMRYPEFEAAGLPIGTGPIEGTCRDLIKGRMDCVGQHWSEENIEGMSALRTFIFNDAFDSLWPPQARLAA